MSGSPVRMYAYFIKSEHGRHGHPIFICDEHEKIYDPPARHDPNLELKKLTDNPCGICFMCNTDAKSFVCGNIE